MKLLHELRERRMAPYMAAYLAGGWIVLQVVDQLADRGVLPEVAYRVVLAIVACALPGAIIVAWFHGERGHQTMPRIEKVLLSLVTIVSLVAAFAVWRSGSEGDPGAGRLDPDLDPRRVAVTYFESRGGGEETEMLSAGLTESLIDELSAVEALAVVSRNGVAQFRGRPISPDSVGSLLGVGTVVNGIVQVAGERVRVDVSVATGGTGRQLASQRIERPRDELFDLQDELAEVLALFLREQIGEEFELIESRAQARSVEAWEVVQQARRLSDDAAALGDQGDPSGASRLMAEADRVLAEAEALDPDWVVPPTQRGWLAYEQSRLTGFDRSEYERWIAVGLDHAARALAKGPSDPDALELRATLHYWQYLLNLAGGSDESARTLQSAEADFRAAIAEDPLQASAWSSLSHLLMNRGATAEAKLAASRSYEADPYLRTANLTLWRLFTASLDLGDDIESRRWCDEGARRFPDDQRFWQCQVRAMALPGSEPDISRLWDVHARVVELSTDSRREFDDKEGRMWMAMALVRAGLPDSARAVALAARGSAQVDPVRDLAYFESIVHTWLGDYDEATRLLGLYLAANPGISLDGSLGWWWEDLVGTPQFRQLTGGR